MSAIADIAIYLLAALVAVPLFRVAGFGAVLGYLAAGVVIGPEVLGLIGEVESVMHVAEIGVVLLLFVIGLELKPNRLWALRKAIFGTGSVQVLAATLPLAWLLQWVFALGWPQALFVGFALALSSTAFVLQSLAEQGTLSTNYGRGAFGVLLFQDLAVIPGLAILPVLAAGSSGGAPTWTAVLEGLGAIVALVVGGRYLLRPILRAVARWGSEETFTVAALLVVMGAALAMEYAELSAGLGAFLAGVLLADSEYRHELEGNINPFKGLLLGLFFMSVGMSADLSLFAAHPWMIAGGTLALLGIKAVTLILAARWVFGQRWEVAVPMGLVLAQGGEFAFVLFHAADGLGVLPPEAVELLIAVVIVSMLLTPLLFIAATAAARRLAEPETRPYDAITPEDGSRIIICGFGRMGQIVARVLHMRGIPFTALERDIAHVDLVRRWGNKVYFGEPASLETLRAAGAREAQLLVITLDDFKAAARIVELARHNFPHLKLMGRARDRQQALHLMELGMDFVIRETWLSSLELAQTILKALGDSDDTAQYSIEVFRDADEELLQQQRKLRDDQERLIQSAKAVRRELRSLFENAPRMSAVDPSGEPPSRPRAQNKKS